MRVLVVDDEPLVLESGRLLLRNLGFDVHAVGHADAILSTMRELRPKVVLQDIRMPGLDLARLIESIRADATLRGTRIVLCSGSMEVADIARRVGADDWIEKPYSPAEIRGKIELQVA